MTLAQVRRLALALPQAAEAPHSDYTLAKADPKVVAGLLRRAWADKAPRSLAGSHDA